MTPSDPWVEWARIVLSSLEAPLSQVNSDTLWTWSGFESGEDRMRWLNPLNTTQPGPGAVPMNLVGVKAYPSVEVGAIATVQTLGNGDYPTIVDHLRRSIPASTASWADACGELITWGTGCSWLSTPEGGPSLMDHDQVVQAVHDALDSYFAGAIAPGQTSLPGELEATLQKVEQVINSEAEAAAKLDAIRSALGASGAPTGLGDLKASLDVVVAAVGRLEAALRQA